MKAIAGGVFPTSGGAATIRAGRASFVVAVVAALLAAGMTLALRGLGSDSSPLPYPRVESEISAGLPASSGVAVRPVQSEISAGLAGIAHQNSASSAFLRSLPH